MSIVLKRVFSGFVVLSLFFAVVACSPDPDTKVPTKTIVIKNIPAKIAKTNKNSTEDPADLWKVYVQLSNGTNVTAKNVALGETKVSDTERAEKSADETTYTVSIDLYVPDPDEYWILHKDSDPPYQGTDWANVAVIISPRWVDDIFDIDARAASPGAGSDSTVVLDWKKMITRKGIILFSGLDSYERLYGKEGAEDGVIVHDPDPERQGAREKAGAGDAISEDDFKVD